MKVNDIIQIIRIMIMDTLVTSTLMHGLFQAKTLKQIKYQQKTKFLLEKEITFFFSQSLEQRGHFTLACKYNMIRLCKFDKKKIDFYFASCICE